MTSAIANKTQSSLRMGYASGVTLDTADSNSILSKSESDATYLKLSGGTLSGNVAMGGNKITGIINGVNSNDVMTKGYIDGADAVLQG